MENLLWFLADCMRDHAALFVLIVATWWIAVLQRRLHRKFTIAQRFILELGAGIILSHEVIVLALDCLHRTTEMLAPVLG